MYSKTRNTLTALLAASLFLSAGWMLGRPVEASDASLNANAMHISIAGAGAQITLGPSVLHARHPNRMSLAMPYYSFSLAMSQRQAD